MKKSESTVDPEEKVVKKKPSTKGTTKKQTKATAKTKAEELTIDEAPEESNGLIDSEDNPTIDLKSLLAAVYGKKTVEKMSYYEKKNIYGATETSTDNLHRDVNARAKSRIDWIKEEFAELSLAANPAKNVIKWVKVIGVEEDEKYGLCMIARLCNKDPYIDQMRGQFKIKIPVSEFRVFDPADEQFSGKKGYFHFTRELDKMMNINVQVMVYEVNEKSRTAIASRLAASERLASYYFKEDENGKAKYKVGDILTGMVVSAKKDSIIVSVYGQDFKVKTAEAKWNCVRALFDEFKIGQYVNVKILSIDNNFEWKVNGRSYNLSKVEGSCRQAEEDPNIVYYDDYAIGGKYVGQIKHITADGLKAFVSLGKDVLCVCDAPLLGVAGDESYIMITKKDDETHQFWGNILKADV